MLFHAAGPSVPADSVHPYLQPAADPFSSVPQTQPVLPSTPQTLVVPQLITITCYSVVVVFWLVGLVFVFRYDPVPYGGG